jgi:hypothetical protein
MRQFCAQNFSSIECNCEELSCKRPAGRTAILTDSRVYSLFEYTKRDDAMLLICEEKKCIVNQIENVVTVSIMVIEKDEMLIFCSVLLYLDCEFQTHTEDSIIKSIICRLSTLQLIK